MTNNYVSCFASLEFFFSEEGRKTFWFSSDYRLVQYPPEEKKLLIKMIIET